MKSKHIFLQINTDNIIKLYEERKKEVEKRLKKELRKELKKERGKGLKEKLKKELKEKLEKEAILTSNEILSNCLIYSQGAMALGDPIKKFMIKADPDEEVYFTIVPLFLFNRHKLYFEKLKCVDYPSIDTNTVPKLGGKSQPVSFSINTDLIKKHSDLPFSLTIILEYQNVDGSWENPPIKLVIDPVLQLKQD